MSEFLLIALGGAIGSVGRWLLVSFADVRLSAPWGTLLVNVLGCLAIGLVANIDRPWIKPLVMIGLLGGFTTFSAFGLQTITLLNSGEFPKAVLYVVSSVVVCLLAVWVGLQLSGWLMPSATTGPSSR